MLVLTVKLGQTVKLDGGITVTFLDWKGSAIRIGIDAPQDVGIYRPVNVADTRDDRPREIERGND
jgi:carbon storage regulator CsrA